MCSFALPDQAEIYGIGPSAKDMMGGQFILVRVNTFRFDLINGKGQHQTIYMSWSLYQWQIRRNITFRSEPRVANTLLPKYKDTLLCPRSKCRPKLQTRTQAKSPNSLVKSRTEETYRADFYT